MERLLIVNADDFGLSKGQNYGIIEACRNGIVTSTTALVNGQAIDHAVQLSRDEPSLAIGMHFVLTMGKPLTAMPGLTRDGVLGKWIWQLAEEDALPLEEITQELASQYLRFIELFGRKPTHLDSHHHVHMFPQIFPIVARFAAEQGIALRADRQMAFDLPVNLRTTQGFSSAFYGEVNRPGFPGECFICELRLPDHRFRWKHNKLFLLLPEEYGPAFPAIVDCYTSPPTLVWPVPLLHGFSSSYGVLPPLCKDH